MIKTIGLILLTIDALYLCVVSMKNLFKEDWIQDFKQWNDENLDSFK